MTSCSTRIGEEKKVNKRAGFCKKRTAWLFMQEYAIRLKALKSFNLRMDITKCVQAIAAFSVIKKSTSVEE